MQVGISQLVMRDMSMAEFLQQSASAGYEVVELCMRAEGELTPQTSEAELKHLTGLVRAAGLEAVSMTHSHCKGNLLDSGPAQHQAIEETCAGLRAAATMGIGCTLHTLGRMTPELYYDEAYKNGVASLKEIAKTAEALGVDLAIEFIWNGFLFSPLEMRRFLEEVGSNRIGFYFDPGNMAVFQFPHHWVKIVGPYIKMVHLKDWKGPARQGDWPPLLEGNVDFAVMNRELRAISYDDTIGYDGPMISEVPPSVAPIEQTAEAIRKIIAM